MEHTERIKELEYQLSHEITTRKAAESALAKAGIEMPVTGTNGKEGAEIDAVSAEEKFKQARKIIEESINAKKAFLTNISHEIRTPMHCIMGIAALLARTALSERQHSYLNLIQENVSNLLVTVNNVLDLDKMISGDLKVEKVLFRLVDKLTVSVQAFKYQAVEKGLSFVFQNAVPKELVVIVDQFRLNQVLNNILSNALKFTEKGNIVVRTSIETTDEDTAVFECSVRDTGIGMSQETLEKTFVPFSLTDATILRKYGGRGLGLSISKSLLALQSGALNIKSDENIGTTVTFRLPFLISEEPVPEAETSQELNFQSLGKRKVLVAEGQGATQFITKHIMESWGFDVAVAAGGRQAINMLQRESYDLVLMDIQMTDVDGIAATRRIRAMMDAEKSTVPIIGIANEDMQNDSELCLASGMSDYLSKPFSEVSLFQAVARNLTHDKINSSNMESSKASESESNPVTTLYDLSMIIEVSGGDEEFVKKMVALFIETVPVNLKELNTYLEAGNWDMVSKMAHKLKSTIDSMGIHSLNQDIRTVENTAKKKEALENIPALVENINVIIGQCIKQLEAEITVPDQP